MDVHAIRRPHPWTESAMGRRAFLTALGGASALAAMPRWARAGQAARPAPPGRIDVHYHGNSPGFIAAIRAHNTGQQPLMNWTPTRAIEDMDRDGVAVSIMSTSEPGVWFGTAADARALARECNEYFATLTSARPDRWGWFATLPLPDIDGTLAEIAYAFDTLKADGACFMSSYQGKYLGDPAFAPVMDELNRRRAVVYTHPFRGESMVNLLPEGRALGITLTTETTLTIQSVLTSGTATRCPNIRFIWSHGGGTMPYITSRVGAGTLPNSTEPNPTLKTIQGFYYDVAQAFNPYTLASLTKLVPASHILFGTDYPFAQAGAVSKGLMDFGFAPDALAGIERNNALALFPRLARV